VRVLRLTSVGANGWSSEVVPVLAAPPFKLKDRALFHARAASDKLRPRRRCSAALDSSPATAYAQKQMIHTWHRVRTCQQRVANAKAGASRREKVQ